MVRLYDARDGRLIRVLVGHGTSISALASHPRLPILASASNQPQSTVRLWDTETGLFREFPGFAGGTYCLAFSPDGETLALGGHKGIRLSDLRTGRITAVSGENAQTSRLAWSPDGRTLAFNLDENGPYLLELRGLAQRSIAHDRGIMALAWSSDGRQLALGHVGLRFVSLVDSATGAQRAPWSKTIPASRLLFHRTENQLSPEQAAFSGIHKRGRSVIRWS